MNVWRRGAAAVLGVLSMLAVVAGCARKPYLVWHGGDVFGVFDAEGRAPSRLECLGSTEQRFECFVGSAFSWACPMIGEQMPRARTDP